jgi:hypothetical protein
MKLAAAQNFRCHAMHAKMTSLDSATEISTASDHMV